MAKIETEQQYEATMARIEELLKLVGEDTLPEDRNSVELVLLSNLVAEYEDLHYPIRKPSLPDVLKLKMYEMGLSQIGLASLLGMNQSKISEILSGKTEPTLKQARKMVQCLNISPAVIPGA